VRLLLLLLLLVLLLGGAVGVFRLLSLLLSTSQNLKSQ
jgi:hypothetical protein